MSRSSGYPNDNQMIDSANQERFRCVRPMKALVIIGSLQKRTRGKILIRLSKYLSRHQRSSLNSPIIPKAKQQLLSFLATGIHYCVRRAHCNTAIGCKETGRCDTSDMFA